MDPARKVLIFHASAGHGHEMAAKAVAEAYRKLRPSYRVEVHDTIELAGAFAGGVYRQTYLVQIKRAPWLWGWFYYSFDVPWIYAVMKIVRRVLNALTCAALERMLVDAQPDIVVATHFQALEVASHLKSRGLLRSRLVAVVTDYLPHHVWTADGIDRYAVAIEETAEGLVRRGVRADRVRVTGIPIGAKFAVPVERAAAAAKVGIRYDRFTVLVTSGGVGISSMEEIVRALLALSDPLQVLVVCGNNDSLRRRLESIASGDGRLKIFGFVDNMHELMSASDVLAGKGGGLTTTESFVKGLPVLLFRPVPGQEVRNAALFERTGAGFSTSDPRRLAEAVRSVMASPEKTAKMRSAAARLAKADAAGRIVEWAES